MLTFRYIKRSKARKELMELQRDLLFYEPLYLAVHPFHEWFQEKWELMRARSKMKLETDSDLYREVILHIPVHLMVFKQAIRDYGNEADTSFFEETIEYIEHLLDTGDEKHHYMIIFDQMQIFERAEFYLYLKKREAELLTLLGIKGDEN
ncbi:hypothetical protein [Paenibacillus sp. DMB5]|uniref:hypothetical protein n=1 Tax=Paenibacillus sp. DMB5 TaxID=1780103 RepID=UPI00076CA2B8|nr:hypothetical protein [Paenibacillus sp. DMB5]KUP22809.1 hypothetical protein AWJ19_14550 [Paenibacillus sp. DMB5]